MSERLVNINMDLQDLDMMGDSASSPVWSDSLFPLFPTISDIYFFLGSFIYFFEWTAPLNIKT